MQHKPLHVLFFLGSLLALLLGTAAAVDAQCGSEASSCKNCHEVQAQDPVNSDGTGWHESHAFGDFCYICHAGNQQSMDKDIAHEGMEPPLADIKASCQSCHPDDLNELADVYAKALGVEIGARAPATAMPAAAVSETEPTDEPVAESVSETTGAAVAVSDQPEVCPPGSTELAVDDPNLVDYVQHYNQVVLGETPTNWGDLTLIGLIGLLVLGGGGFVVVNEARRGRANTAAVEGVYPAEVVEMLPALTNLKPQSRKSLKNLLRHPEKSDKVLGLIDAVIDADDEPKE